MARPKKIKNPVRISFQDEEAFLEHLHKQVIYMSKEEERTLTISEIIRRGLRVAFPLPKQEMFKY